jgi:ferredoxin
MAFLRVDEGKCKKDGICVTECPFGLIKLQEETGHPALIPGGEERCSRWFIFLSGDGGRGG